MIRTFGRALSRLLPRTEGPLQVDSIVLMAGLMGLGLIVLAAAGIGVDALSSNDAARARMATLSPDFDASTCPDNWIIVHAANTGLMPVDLEGLYAEKDLSTDNATILALLGAHAKTPRDFRYRAPMRLAELQIMMCLAEDRKLPLPAPP